jgi:FkbM family methyltransferase
MTRYPYDLFIDPRFQDVYRQQPLVLVDVGARGGLKSNWAAARPHLRMIGFEPDKREHARLIERSADRETTFFSVALSNRTGPVQLNVARDRGLSSIFQPDRSFLDAFPEASRFDTIAVEKVEADTLDNLLRSRQITEIDFVKVDTQGSELLVLEGGRAALAASGLGVEVEAEFTPIYKGQPLFADVDAFMRSLGYMLFDLRPCYWKRAAGRSLGGPRGQIIWTDALYLKSLQSLRATLAGIEASRRTGKALKAISVALLYGYCDYALEIARDLGTEFMADERKVIERRLLATRRSRGPLARIPGRRHAAAALHRISRLLRPMEDGWSVSNANLGNFR